MAKLFEPMKFGLRVDEILQLAAHCGGMATHLELFVNCKPTAEGAGVAAAVAAERLMAASDACAELCRIARESNREA